MSIWKNFRFSRFFIAFTVGNLGDWFDIFALQIIFVKEFHASPILMGVLMILYFIPGVVLGPIAGVWADRFSQRNLMIITDVIAALLTIGLFLSTNISIVMLIILLRSSIATVGGPNQQAYIKHVVPSEYLLQATSYTSVVFQMCKVLGPIIGAVLLIVFPARSCIFLNAISFALSAGILLTLPKDKRVKRNDDETSTKGKNTWIHDIRCGWGYIESYPLMRNMMIIVVIWLMCSMMRNSQLAVFLNQILPKETNILGYIIGLDALGAVMMGAILSRRGNVENYHRYFAVGFFLLGLGVMGIAIYQTSWPIIFLYASVFILGMGSAISSVMYGYILKKETMAHQVGCVAGISGALQNIGLAVGAISSGFLVTWLGTRMVYIGLALVFLMLSLSAIILLRVKITQKKTV